MLFTLLMARRLNLGLTQRYISLLRVFMVNGMHLRMFCIKTGLDSSNFYKNCH